VIDPRDPRWRPDGAQQQGHDPAAPQGEASGGDAWGEAIGLSDPRLARVRVQELMSWLGTGRATARISSAENDQLPRWYRQPPPQDEAPQPQPIAAFPAPPPPPVAAAEIIASPPLPPPNEAVASAEAPPNDLKKPRKTARVAKPVRDTRRRDMMQLSSAWTLPRRVAVMRTPDFVVSGTPVEFQFPTAPQRPASETPAIDRPREIAAKTLQPQPGLTPPATTPAPLRPAELPLSKMALPPLPAALPPMPAPNPVRPATDVAQAPATPPSARTPPVTPSPVTPPPAPAPAPPPAPPPAPSPSPSPSPSPTPAPAPAPMVPGLPEQGYDGFVAPVADETARAPTSPAPPSEPLTTDPEPAPPAAPAPPDTPPKPLPVPSAEPSQAPHAGLPEPAAAIASQEIEQISLETVTAAEAEAEPAPMAPVEAGPAVGQTVSAAGDAPQPPALLQPPELQSAETVAPDTAEEWALPPSPPRAHASLRAWLVLAALLLGTGLAGWGVWLTWLRPGPTAIDAVVIGQTKPVLAPAEGQLSHIFVAPGDRVASRTDLFEIAPRPADPKIRAELTARLELARSRQIRFGLRIQELNSLVLRAAAVPDLASQREAEQGRMRLRDVQDQAVSTAEEVALLEQSLSGETKRPASATLVRAERHGVLTRIQAVEGMDVVPGLQLAEIVDCAALSLSVDGAAAAAAGFSSGRKITVQMPGRRVGEGVFTVLVPDAAERAKGAEFGRSNGRLILPVDLTVWERAGGEVCPIGNRVSVQAR